MAYIKYNANPNNNRVGDCVIRAISKATGISWDKVFMDIVLEALYMYDMPSSNAVWGNYLTSIGFEKHIIPSNCPDCYTIIDFCNDYPQGTYVVATGTHTVAVIDGNYYDTWDSGDEVPIYYFKRR